jgi:hypothetical protein
MEPLENGPEEATFGPGQISFWPAGAVRLEARFDHIDAGPGPRLLVLNTEPEPRASPGPVALSALLIRATLLEAPRVHACLLTPEERARQRHTHAMSQDVHLLATRLGHLLHDFRDPPALTGRSWRVLCCGHTVAAALVCATALPGRIEVILSWQGRPDLAGAALDGVRCPVLLAVAKNDTPMVDLNRRAQRRMPGAQIADPLRRLRARGLRSAPRAAGSSPPCPSPRERLHTPGRQPTSTCASSSDTVSGGATGKASRTAAAPSRRRLATSASKVAPVAAPPSTSNTLRPFTSNLGLTVLYNASRSRASRARTSASAGRAEA